MDTIEYEALSLVHELAGEKGILILNLSEFGQRLGLQHLDTPRVLLRVERAGKVHLEYLGADRIRLSVPQEVRPVPEAVKTAGLSDAEYRVYAHLFQLAGVYGVVRISPREQADQLGVSMAAVQRARKELMRRGFIETVPSKAGELTVLPMIEPEALHPSA